MLRGKTTTNKQTNKKQQQINKLIFVQNIRRGITLRQNLELNKHNMPGCFTCLLTNKNINCNKATFNYIRCK